MEQLSKPSQVLEILTTSPVSGLYLNEDPSQWQNFFDDYRKFLLLQEGPRGDAIKFSRSYLEKNPNATEHSIKQLGLDGKDYLMRDVFTKFKTFVPTPLYTRYLVDSAKLEEVGENAKKIVDENSLMYKNIEKGLLQKHGQGIDVKERMKEITQSYLTKLAERKIQVSSLKQELQKSKQYQEYIIMKDYLNPIIQIFEKTQRQIGNGNAQRGKLFEQRCLGEGVERVYEKLGRKNFQVAKNCRWNPAQLGEVDIALIENIDGVRTVTVLIECKARLFDLYAGSKQIGPERITKNKTLLRVGKDLLPVLNDAKYFIITCVPTNFYHLAFESRLKAELERATKTIPFAELNSKEIYNILAPKFANQISPLDWFKQNADEHVIVI